MKSTARPAVVTFLSLLVLGFAASPSRAAEWNQQKVTKIAEQIAEASRLLNELEPYYESFRKNSR